MDNYSNTERNRSGYDDNMTGDNTKSRGGVEGLIDKAMGRDTGSTRDDFGNTSSTSGFGNDSMDTTGRSTGGAGLGRTGYGDDSVRSSGRDNLDGSGRDTFGSGTGRDNFGSTTDDSYGASGRGTGVGDNSYGSTGRSTGIGDDLTSGTGMTSGRKDPRDADTNYAGAPVRPGTYSGTDTDTYGSTGTGMGRDGSDRITSSTRGDNLDGSGIGSTGRSGMSGSDRYGDDSLTGSTGRSGMSGSDRYGDTSMTGSTGRSGMTGSRDTYGDNDDYDRKDSSSKGNDSTMGKLVEKVGAATGNTGLAEKGRDMREKQGFDSTYDDTSARGTSGRDNDNY